MLPQTRLSAIINLYLINALNPFKSASYKCTVLVCCGHLNALYTHVET